MAIIEKMISDDNYDDTHDDSDGGNGDIDEKIMALDGSDGDIEKMMAVMATLKR